MLRHGVCRIVSGIQLNAVKKVGELDFFSGG
jgi:hypothetical protein